MKPSMSLQSDSETAITNQEEMHCWVAWPAAERKGRTMALLLAIFLLSALTGFVGGDWLWGISGFVLLFLVLNRWFLPSSFSANAERIEVGYPLTRRSILWKDVRRVALDSRGGWISRRAQPSRFNSRSGLDLYWGRNPERNILVIIGLTREAEAAGVPLVFTDSREVRT